MSRERPARERYRIQHNMLLTKGGTLNQGELIWLQYLEDKLTEPEHGG